MDAPLGKGHLVLFALRPFWRWQTQGTYTLGFNAIMNWNDLDAGTSQSGGRARTARSSERAATLPRVCVKLESRPERSEGRESEWGLPGAGG